MTLPEERLLAYVDGELGPDAAAEVEAALARDAEAAAFVQRERALRRRLQAAFSPVLDEPVPGRLAELLAQPQAPGVVDLQAERVRRRSPLPSPAGSSPARRPWPLWLGLAASVMFSTGIGFALGQRSMPDGSGVLASADGGLVARGALALALTTQTGADLKGPVRLGLSFLATDGHYCRSFTLASQATAGLACEQAGRWQVQVLARQDAAPDGAYRQAASPWPPALLEAVDRRMNGAPLDAEGEAEAIRRGWQR